ncbi:hypothetical protein [Priestia megaterium]|uniref:hypothetical protein n=1 Tax=Priestia megaterium TaxID=1404 RepID=UPI000FC3C072
MFIEVETVRGVRTINTDYIVQFEAHPEYTKQTVVKLSSGDKLYAACEYEEFKKKVNM